LLSSTLQIWNGSTWVYTQQIVNTYDDNSNRITSVVQNWVDLDWVNFYQEIYTYDDQNLLETYTSQIFEEDVWVNADQYTYSYSSQGFRVSALWEVWQNDQWKNFAKYSYTNNIHGGVQLALMEIWDEDEWVNSTMLNNTYDNNGNTLVSDLYHWTGSGWTQSSDGLLQLFYGNSSQVIYFTGYKAEASYTSTAVGNFEIENGTGQNFRVFPNPLNLDAATIDLTIPHDGVVQLNLYDISGKKVIEVLNDWIPMGQSNITFQAYNLPDGVYMLQLIADKWQTQEKLIINNK
jgi:hypothetical protein